MKELKDLCRENIWNLAPYSCARTEFVGRNARVFLDANENPYNDPYNRYPDPLQVELKKQISKIKGVTEEKIFLGNGSDEAIDLAPEYADGYLLLGLLQKEKGNKEEAIKNLKKAQELGDTRAEEYLKKIK
jgi:tetratricopeptide (TPR) repeat protein